LLLARRARRNVAGREAEHAHAVFVVGQGGHARGFAAELPELRRAVPLR
jgi:hypothetical protein